MGAPGGRRDIGVERQEWQNEPPAHRGSLERGQGPAAAPHPPDQARPPGRRTCSRPVPPTLYPPALRGRGPALKVPQARHQRGSSHAARSFLSGAHAIPGGIAWKDSQGVGHVKPVLGTGRDGVPHPWQDLARHLEKSTMSGPWGCPPSCTRSSAGLGVQGLVPRPVAGVQAGGLIATSVTAKIRQTLTMQLASS